MWKNTEKLWVFWKIWNCFIKYLVAFPRHSSVWSITCAIWSLSLQFAFCWHNYALFVNLIWFLGHPISCSQIPWNGRRRYPHVSLNFRISAFFLSKGRKQWLQCQWSRLRSIFPLTVKQGRMHLSIALSGIWNKGDVVMNAGRPVLFHPFLNLLEVIWKSMLHSWL